MTTMLKRKGSPGLEDESESSNKRRFAEAELVTGNDDIVQAGEQIQEELQEAAASAETTGPAPSAASDRAARFAALRARNKDGRKSNLAATRNEAQRQATDPKQLTALHRKRDVAAHKLLKADTEAAGEDFERKRAWDWTVEESERWDERMAEKARRKGNVAFADYRQEAGKVYDRQVERMGKAIGERKEEYERDKKAAIERAIKSGGLEIVETDNGELIAVDKDGAFYSTADSMQFVQNKPDRAAVDRLVEDIRQAEEVRLRKRRERGRNDEDGDVTYINEKNKQFNQKLARFYNKYTADIRDSFERGTAI